MTSPLTVRPSPRWVTRASCSGKISGRRNDPRARRSRRQLIQAVSSRWPTFPNGPATGRCLRSRRRFLPRRLPPTPASPPASRNPLERKPMLRLDPSDLVPETWSRWAEWGPNLLIVVAWVALLFLLVYFVFGLEFYGLAFALLLVGGLVAVVLSYPMLITLERPVRITPEQAVRDYYTALSHHVPHFRRMWLLLSAAGRISAAFGSFEGFKGYWKEQLARLRQGHAGALTPLVFEVVNFKSEKSAGKSRIDATFALNVSVRGQRAAGAIHTIPATIALVRGPDNMWYLESGTLPRGEPNRKATSS